MSTTPTGSTPSPSWQTVPEAPPRQSPPNELVMFVYGGTDLLCMDSNGLSDPFCDIQCGAQACRTSVKEETLDPEWNEAFAFDVVDASTTLEIICKDKDLMSDDLIGVVKMPISALLKPHVPQVSSLALLSKSLKTDLQRGSIKLGLLWRHNPERRQIISSKGIKKGSARYMTTSVAKSMVDPPRPATPPISAVSAPPEAPPPEASASKAPNPKKGKTPSTDPEGEEEVYLWLAAVRGVPGKSGSGVKALIKCGPRRMLSETASVDSSAMPTAAFGTGIRAPLPIGAGMIDPIWITVVGPKDKTLLSGMVPLHSAKLNDSRQSKITMDSPERKGAGEAIVKLLRRKVQGKSAMPRSTLPTIQLADYENAEAALLSMHGEEKAVAGGEEEEEEDEETPPPNELIVTVHAGKNLMAADVGGTSDPFVVLQVKGQVKKTQIILKELNPQWNETYAFVLPDDSVSEQVKITVWDYDKLASDDFLGQVTFQMASVPWHREIKQWFPLSNEKGAVQEDKRGSLELSLHWRYNEDLDDTTMSDEDGLEEREAEAEREAEEAERERLTRLSDVKLGRGDYQIQVHIIEVRDLKAEDGNGTSDPMVYVEAFGEKKHTKVMKKRTACVFDELFFFNAKNVEPEDIQAQTIRLGVYDWDLITSNDLIGSFQVDVPTVYYREHHELYRQWVALIDTKDKKDHGIQGYLRASITILGPGDKQYIHPPEDSLEDGTGKEGDLQSMVMMPPSVKQHTQFLVLTIHETFNLPMMDTNPLNRGIDAYVMVEFAANQPLKTKCHSLRGRQDSYDAVFNETLWLPVSVPTLTGTIKISVWDKNTLGKDSLVGVAFLDWNHINAHPLKLKWLNVYGAQTNGGIPSGDKAKKMNTVPSTASSYRGRIIVSARVEEDKKHKVKDVAHKKRAKPLRRAVLEQTLRTFSLQAFVARGSDIPIRRSRINWGSTRKVAVEVCIGPYCKSTTRTENELQGQMDFSQLLSLNNLRLPKDVRAIPDIFVYIVIGKGDDRKRISFARIPATTLLAKKRRFAFEPFWLPLKPDPVVDVVEEHEFPGSILLSIGLGIPQKAAYGRFWPRKARKLLQTPRPFQLRVHLYQARDLLAADADGQSDPYCVVHVCGQQQKTEIQRHTLDPVWYSTLCFDIVLPGIELAPQAAIQVFDWDRFSQDDLLGITHLPISESFVLPDHQDMMSTAPRGHEPCSSFSVPSWRILQLGGTFKGAVLASVQLIPKRSFSEELLPPPDIRPTMCDAFVDVLALGCRNLKPYACLPMQNPELQFRVNSSCDCAGGCPRCKTYLTSQSSKPTAKNPNFADRIVIPARLPKDPLFAPSLAMQLKDHRLGGFLKPTVGTASVGLIEKVPWYEEHYKGEMATPMFDDADDLNSTKDGSGAMKATSLGVGGFFKAGVGETGAFLERGASSLGLGMKRGAEKFIGGLGGALKGVTTDLFTAGSEQGATGVAKQLGKGTVNLISKTGMGILGGAALLMTGAAGVVVGKSAKAKMEHGLRHVTEFDGDVFATRSPDGFAEALKRRPEPKNDSKCSMCTKKVGSAMMFNTASRHHCRKCGSTVCGKCSAGKAYLPALGYADPQRVCKQCFEALKEEDSKAGHDVEEKKAEEEPIPDSLKLPTTPSEADALLPPQVEDEEETDTEPSDGEDDVLSTMISHTATASAEPVVVEAAEQATVNEVVPAMEEIEEKGEEEEEEEKAAEPALSAGEVVVELPDDLGVEGAEPRRVSTHAPSFEIPPELDDDTPRYMKGRQVVLQELESTFESQVFETIPLERGQDSATATGIAGLLAKDKAETGRFKGVIRVVTDEAAPPPFSLQSALNPKSYVVRLYVLEGRGLPPMDSNNLADPYLKVKLGKKTLDDVRCYKKGTLKPDFFRCFEFTAILPGESQLEVEVWDHDLFSPDEFIGKTTIDLEDRYFNPTWHDMGLHDPLEDPAKKDKKTDEQFGCPKRPVEERTLWTPTSGNSRGNLKLWVDIFSLSEAKRWPIVNIAPPPPKPFELRVVVWKTKNVYSADVSEGGCSNDRVLQFGGMNDLYIKVWLEGQAEKTTDIHFRCSGGAASFNWRFKIPIHLPMEFPRLNIQMWDKDIAKYDDLIAECVVDLTSAMRPQKALKTNKALTVFPSKTKSRFASPATVFKKWKPAYKKPQPGMKTEGKTDDGVIESKENAPLLKGGPEVDANDWESEETLTDGTETAPVKPNSVGAAKEKDAKQLVGGIMESVGLGPDPPDSQWLAMERKDKKGKRKQAGSVLLSAEILPQVVAEAKENGQGRSNPNVFPTLPPPTGRLKLTAMWNPLYVLKAFLGPKMFKRLTICFCLLVIIGLFALGSPAINVGVSMFSSMPEPLNWALLFGGLGAVFAFICCIRCKYRRWRRRRQEEDEEELEEMMPGEEE